MVYEQDGRRWIFFHDLFGRWQWTVVDQAGVTVEQAKGSFASYCFCMKDASTQGFRIRLARSTCVRDPGDDGVALVPGGNGS
jgi:hypothetical protein